MLNPKQMTGLEILNAMAEGLLPAPSICQTMPMQMVSVQHGSVCFRCHADERHFNPLGGIHGGFAATVLDSVTGCAIHSILEAGVGYGTVDLNIKMCRPIQPHQQLLATGKVINASKNLAISEGQLVDAEGKIYAHATATCMIIGRGGLI